MEDLVLGIGIASTIVVIAGLAIREFYLHMSLRTSERRAFGSESSPDGELARRLGTVRSMSGSQFEVFVADVLRGMGYRATVLGGGGGSGRGHNSYGR